MQRMAMAAAEDGPRVPARIPVDVQRHHGAGACAWKEDEGTTARRAGATMEVHDSGNGAAARWFFGQPFGVVFEPTKDLANLGEVVEYI